MVASQVPPQSHLPDPHYIYGILTSFSVWKKALLLLLLLFIKQITLYEVNTEYSYYFNEA